MRASRASTAPPKLHSLTVRPVKYPNANWAAWGYSRSPSDKVGFSDSKEEDENAIEEQQEEGNFLLDRLEEEIDKHISTSRNRSEVESENEMAKHDKMPVKTEPGAERKVKTEKSESQEDLIEKKKISLEIQEKIRIWEEKHLRKPTKPEFKKIAKRVKKEWDERKLSEIQDREIVDLAAIPERVVEGNDGMELHREGTRDTSISMDLDFNSPPSQSNDFGGQELAWWKRNKEMIDAAARGNAPVSQAIGDVKQDTEEEDIYNASPEQGRKMSQVIADLLAEKKSKRGEQKIVTETETAGDDELVNGVGPSHTLMAANDPFIESGHDQGEKETVDQERGIHRKKKGKGSRKEKPTEPAPVATILYDPMEVDAVDGVPIRMLETVDNQAADDSRAYKKKRKRATSNAESLLMPTSEIEGAGDTEPHEPPKKKQKKQKKSKRHRQDQESILVADTENGSLSHREAVNKVKEKSGKTISKKRRRREEQQSQQSAQATRGHELEDHAAQGDDNDDLPWDERILNHAQSSSQVTSNLVPGQRGTQQSISKKEALIRTVTHPQLPSTPSKVLPSSQRSQAPSPTTPITSSGFTAELERINASLQSAEMLARPIRESPIKPPLTFAARQRSASMSSSPLKANARAQLVQRQRSVSPSPAPIKANEGKQKEKVVQQHAELASGLDSVVKDIRKVVTNISALFSALPVQSSPTVHTNTAKPNGDSNQKETKSQGHDAQKTSLLSNWESKGGRIQAYVAGDEEGTEVKENIAFSSSYIMKKRSVSISNTTVSTINLEVGKMVVLSTDEDDEDEWKLKVCSVAEGRVRVDLGGDEEDGIEGTVFEISRGGMWRIRVGERCEVMALSEEENEGENGGGATISVVSV